MSVQHIAVGDTVLYYFRRSGDPPLPLDGRDPTLWLTCRPAIITSIVDDKSPVRIVNLHVFFEFPDVEIRMTSVTSSMGSRMENVMYETGPGRTHRVNVLELVGLTPMRVALDGNVWRTRGVR